MKLKKKENQSVDASVILRRGIKIPMGGETDTKCGAETEVKAIQRLPDLGPIPYTVTKFRHYCGFQQVLTDRALISLSPERFCQCLTNSEVDAHSQPLDWAQGPQWKSWRKDPRS